MKNKKRADAEKWLAQFNPRDGRCLICEESEECHGVRRLTK